jgi:5-methylcytosine-specific restriction endonuclease McrA
LGCLEEAVTHWSAHALMKEQKEAAQVPLSVRRIKRQYVWAKSSGLCWYCGAQLYSRGEADTAVKKEFIFTADHVHPRKYGGRGRANKVPACKYCNSHKSSRSVEEFRQWVGTQLSDNSVPLSNQALGRWKINNGRVVFYFELVEVRQQG